MWSWDPLSIRVENRYSLSLYCNKNKQNTSKDPKRYLSPSALSIISMPLFLHASQCPGEDHQVRQSCTGTTAAWLGTACHWPGTMGPGIRGINIANQVHSDQLYIVCLHEHVLCTTPTRDCVICCLLDRLSNDPGAEGGSWNVQKSRLANEKLFQGLTCVIVRPALQQPAARPALSSAQIKLHQALVGFPKFWHRYIQWLLIGKSSLTISAVFHVKTICLW